MINPSPVMLRKHLFRHASITKIHNDIDRSDRSIVLCIMLITDYVQENTCQLYLCQQSSKHNWKTIKKFSHALNKNRFGLITENVVRNDTLQRFLMGSRLLGCYTKKALKEVIYLLMFPRLFLID